MENIAQQRSRVSNGKPPAGVDGRSAWYRRKKDLIADITDALGGADNISVVQRLRIELASGLMATVEETQANLSTNPTDVDREYCRAASGNLQRLLNDIYKEAGM